MEEQETTEAAPELGQAAEASKQDVKASVNASNAVETQKVPTDKAQPAASEFDPKTNYDSLVKQLESVNRSYGDLRKEFTRRTQYESELKKQIDTLSKAFAEATKEEISPEEFIKSIQTQGLKAFNPLREQWTNEIRETYDKELADRDAKVAKLEIDFAIMRRRADSENYPDFNKLEATMQQILDSEDCPVDVERVGSEAALDTLYKLARSYSMETAIKQAKTLGEKEAEAKLAKESATAVAPGGKSGGPTDPTDIKDLAKLRQYFVNQIGEAE